jgi:hypothetical protein
VRRIPHQTYCESGGQCLSSCRRSGRRSDGPWVAAQHHQAISHHLHPVSKELEGGFWDTQFVDALGMPPAALAKKQIAQITPEQEAEWKQGAPDAWAMEAFDISFDDVYGQPPLSKDMPQHLDAAYVARAERDVALQLSRAGVRLAAILNKALGRQVADQPR